MNDLQVRETALDLPELLAIIRRNLFGIIISLVLCMEIAVVLIMYLPRNYKSTAVLDIHSSYFRSPLVSDLLSETSDPGELKAQREALLRTSLTERFIDEIGSEYGIYRAAANTKERRLERERLYKDIEFFSLGPTSFQVSALAGKPRQAYEMIRTVLEQMMATVVDARYRILVQARDAIQAQVQFLGQTLDGLGKANEARQLRQRLADLNANIAALRSKFTEDHPKLAKLQAEAASLRSRVKTTDDPVLLQEDELAKAFLLSSSKAPIQDIYNDLLRKLSHLNIVLTMESNRETPLHVGIIQEPKFPLRPVFPNPRDFLILGAAAGLALALLQTLYFELRRRQTLVPEDVLQALGTLHLGTVPALPGGHELLKLEGVMALPLPAKTGEGR